MGKVTLKVAETNSEKDLVNRTISNFHSCVPNKEYAGRRIDFMIYNDKTYVGMLGLGSYIINEPKIITEFIGWDRELRTQNYNKVATNWRGCFLPFAPKYIGSKALSLFHKQAPKEWKRKYGDKLVLLTTFVHQTLTGTIYKSAGWIYVGKTSGYKFKGSLFSGFSDYKKLDKLSQNKCHDYGKDETLIKDIFVKPLHRYWKKELLSVQNNTQAVPKEQSLNRNLTEDFAKSSQIAPTEQLR